VTGDSRGVESGDKTSDSKTIYSKLSILLMCVSIPHYSNLHYQHLGQSASGQKEDSRDERPGKSPGEKRKRECQHLTLSCSLFFCVCVCVCMWLCVCIHASVRVPVRVRVYTSVRVCVCANVCVLCARVCFPQNCGHRWSGPTLAFFASSHCSLFLSGRDSDEEFPDAEDSPPPTPPTGISIAILF